MPLLQAIHSKYFQNKQAEAQADTKDGESDDEESQVIELEKDAARRFYKEREHLLELWYSLKKKKVKTELKPVSYMEYLVQEKRMN
jgi:hypothetical protein